MISGSISLPSRGSFAFPSRYWFTIGHRRVFSLGRWPSRIQTWFHVSGPTRDTHRAALNFVYGAITHYGVTFQLLRLSIAVSSRVPQHRPVNRTVLATPLSLAATKGISVDFFSSGYLDVSVPRVSPPHPMYSGEDTAEAVGFPIRKSPDQSLFVSSPRLIADYNVLHRPLSPRHPPHALIHLTI